MLRQDVVNKAQWILMPDWSPCYGWPVWCGDIRKPGMWREINLSTFTMFHLVANRFFYSRSTSFSLNINHHQCPLIVPLILFCYTRSRLSLGFPFEFRYISVLPPMILRLFFDRSSINLRFPNGEWTEDERRMNENRSRTEREPNENRSRTDREPNEERTKSERRTIRKKCLYSCVILLGNPL